MTHDTHDTPEAVEARANSCEVTAMAHKQRSQCCGETDCGGTCCAPACLFGETMRDLNNAAAMLRRLHQRAVDAERQLIEQARAGNALFWRFQAERDEARAALAMARADALREFQQGCPFDHPKCSLKPEDPCPACGDLGTWDDENLSKPPRCIGSRKKESQ